MASKEEKHPQEEAEGGYPLTAGLPYPGASGKYVATYHPVALSEEEQAALAEKILNGASASYLSYLSPSPTPLAATEDPLARKLLNWEVRPTVEYYRHEELAASVARAVESLRKAAAHIEEVFGTTAASFKRLSESTMTHDNAEAEQADEEAGK